MKDRLFVASFLFFFSGVVSYCSTYALWSRYISIPYPKTLPKRISGPIDPAKHLPILVGARLAKLPLKHWNGTTSYLEWKQPQILLFVSGCGGCSKPILEEAERIAQSLPSKDIMVISLSSVESTKAVAPQFPHLEIRVDASKMLSQRVGIQFLPQVFLIGTGGIVQYVQPDTQDWLSALQGAEKQIAQKRMKTKP